MDTRRRTLYIALMLAALIGASMVGPPVAADGEADGWRQVTCTECDYTVEVPTFGHPLSCSLEASGGRVQNYLESPDAFREDSHFALRENRYWLEIAVYPEAEIRLRSPEGVCAGDPIPLAPDLRGFWCRRSLVPETDGTYTHVARFHADGRVFVFTLEGSALDSEAVRRILESVDIANAAGG